MRPVQKAQLRLFPGRDRGCHLHAGPKCRARTAKPVLYHPLQKGFGLDHCLVFHTQTPAKCGNIVRRRRWHDPVHHRFGERAFRCDPVRQRRVMPPRQVQDRTAQPLPIMRQIVATDRGKGREPFLLAPRQGRNQIARRGLRSLQGHQISRDLGIPLNQASCGWIELVALLRHGQRDDMRIRRCQRRQQRFGVLWRDDYLADCADDLRPIRRTVAHQHGVEAVLRGHLVPHGGRTQRCRDDAPAQITGIERLFENGRLMRAMKCADAQMDDARPHRRAVIGRTPHITWQGFQMMPRQSRHSLYACFGRS